MIDYYLAAGAGILAGAALTGSPIGFFREVFSTLNLAVDTNVFPSMLGFEMRPNGGNIMYPLTVMAILFGRYYFQNPDEKKRDPIDEPVLVLTIICYILCFRIVRFWYDIGVPLFFRGWPLRSKGFLGQGRCDRLEIQKYFGLRIYCVCNYFFR